jgi:DNA-binding NarL/FixJ family response regulator
MPGKTNQLRVYLVDDHPLMRASLASLLKQELKIVVCGEAQTAEMAKREIVEKKPDLVVLDISLDGGSGFEIIKALRESLPALKIVILSMHDETLYAERCIRRGANGYVMKREPTDRIVEAIRAVLCGKVALSENVVNVFAEKFLAGKGRGGGALLSELSDRELEVFNLLGQGMASRKIAASLGINVKTAQAYCHRIKQKLHLSTATELLREATRWHHDSSDF